MSPRTGHEIEEDLRRVGVREGGVLVVHASFRAVGSVEGGPLGLIAALRGALGPQGTLVMPAMTDGASVFDPRTTPTFGMGITAEMFRGRAGVVRSPHPGASFAAEGPLAARICAPHPLSPPHGVDSPIGRVHEEGGQVLLLGVGHSENTMLHLAEAIAGVPYSVLRPCVVEVDGVAREVMLPETDHCCRNFALADGWLRASDLQREGTIGDAQARLVEARDVVGVAVEKLRAHPLVFLCPRGTGCAECDEAHASIAKAP